MKTSKVLEKAQAVLIRCGWRKGMVGACPGPHCAEGAVSVAAYGDPWATGPLHSAAVKALEDANNLHYLIGFNDATLTTLGDVLRAFDAGIAYAKAQEGE